MGKDGLSYVHLAPGDFLMGCVPGDRECDAIERIQHKVNINTGFYLSSTEVTVSAFRKFVEATGYVPESIKQNKGRVYTDSENWHWMEGIDWEHPFDPNQKADDRWPVMQVSHADAVAYCTWMDGRLPTEAEWEYAARGGLKNFIYPWGDEWPPEKDGFPLANTADENTLNKFSSMKGLKNYDDGFSTVAPIASFPPNPYGFYDMAGNAWEWTSTRFQKGYSESMIDSVFIKNDARVTRGGAWCYYPSQMRCSDRGYFEKEGFWTGSLGFRCVLENISK